MSGFLDEMGEGSRRRADAALAQRSLDQWRALALGAPSPRPLAHDRFMLIAEVKRSSPSEGALSRDDDALAYVVRQAQRYAGAGASIISVLTEPTRFAGDLEHARGVAGAVDVPVMRKDFLVDPVQVYEARAAGCSGVLLIVRMLSDNLMCSMLDACAACGLFALIEAFDEPDLARAGELLPHAGLARQRTLVGVNTRDLSTLKVSPHALERLVRIIPAGFVRIAESGLATPGDAERVAQMGYDGALVGTALVRSLDPGALASEMLHSGRAGVAARATSEHKGTVP